MNSIKIHHPLVTCLRLTEQVMRKVQEKWYPIPGIPHRFQISKSGELKRNGFEAVSPSGRRYNRPTIFIKCVSDKAGYMTCRINKKSYLVHRLLALTFISNPHSKPEVNHINGIKTDNNIKNLEWATRMENMAHARNAGLWNVSGENSRSAKLTVAKVETIRCLKGQFTQKELSEMYGVDRSGISRILNGKSWSRERGFMLLRSVTEKKTI